MQFHLGCKNISKPKSDPRPLTTLALELSVFSGHPIFLHLPICVQTLKMEWAVILVLGVTTIQFISMFTALPIELFGHISHISEGKVPLNCFNVAGDSVHPLAISSWYLKKYGAKYLKFVENCQRLHVWILAVLPIRLDAVKLKLWFQIIPTLCIGWPLQELVILRAIATFTKSVLPMQRILTPHNYNQMAGTLQLCVEHYSSVPYLLFS